MASYYELESYRQRAELAEEAVKRIEEALKNSNNKEWQAVEQIIDAVTLYHRSRKEAGV